MLQVLERRVGAILDILSRLLRGGAQGFELRELRTNPLRLTEMGTRARAVAEKYARVNELQRFSAIMEEAAGAPK